MIRLLIFIVSFFVTNFIFAQFDSDFYPLHVGDFRVQHTDTIFGDYNPSTFRVIIEDVDIINGEEYYRMRQEQSIDNNPDILSFWYMWVRFNSSGFMIGAFSDTSIVEQATLYNPPILAFPSEASTVGYSWEYDLPGTGIGTQHWENVIESISERVEVPAGIFYNCVKVKTVIVDSLGTIIQTFDNYYAKGIGEVLNEGWSTFSDYYKYELVEYNIQSSEADIITISPKDGYLLDLNPNNPFTTIEFTMKNETNSPVSLNLSIESADSTYLLFISQPDTLSLKGNIWRMRPDGSDKTRLTNDTLDFEPAWSPDGSQIGFYSLRSGYFDIWVMDSDGTNLQNISNNVAKDINPQWSNNGEFIIFSSDRDDIYGDIYRITPTGGDIRRLTSNNYQDSRPSYSPDGKYFVTMSQALDNKYYIYLYSSDGLSNINLGATDVQNNFQPSWTPDGKRIIWSCGNHQIGELDIVSAKKDGSDFRLEYSTSENDYIARYSPDGQFLAFSKSTFYPMGGDEIFIWHKFRNRLVQITNNTPLIREWSPSWSPFINSPIWLSTDKELVSLEPGETSTIKVNLDISGLPIKDLSASVMVHNVTDNNLVNMLPININLNPSVSVDKNDELPISFSLSQNYPNPFNSSTIIKYQIPINFNGKTQDVKLIVFDILGREIVTLVNETQKPGNYIVRFDTESITKKLSSGIYFYTLNVGLLSDSKKFVLIE